MPDINLYIKGCPKVRLGNHNTIPRIGEQIRIENNIDLTKTQIFEVKEVKHHYYWHLNATDKQKDGYSVDEVHIDVEQIYG